MTTMTKPVYVSEEGLKKLQEELAERQNQTRKEIAEQIRSAKEQGDLKENAEYAAAKEAQALNETRIAEVDEMIKRAEVIEKGAKGGVITVGSRVVALMDGESMTYEIVGSNEADPLEGRISNESPIGKAFLGKKVGDKIEVDIPAGNVTFEIKEVE